MRLFASKATKQEDAPDRTSNKGSLPLCCKVPVFLCKARSEQGQTLQIPGGQLQFLFRKVPIHNRIRKAFRRLYTKGKTPGKQNYTIFFA